MKKIRRIISSSLFALTLLLSQTGAVLAETVDETKGVADAMKLYQQALPMEVDSPKRKELLDESAEILKQEIARNPESLDAHRKLMGVYLLQQDYTRGISTMQDAITLSPEDPKLFIALAFLYEHSGAFEYSTAMLKQALALDPNNELAKEYLVAVEQKIEARKMEDLHQGKQVMGSGHGKPNDAVHGKPNDAAHGKPNDAMHQSTAEQK